jgi:hypothetical protein
MRYSKEDGPTFADLLNKAKRGEDIVYHTGPYCDGPHANDAWKAYEKGIVVLVQRRVKDSSSFQYIARRLF